MVRAARTALLLLLAAVLAAGAAFAEEPEPITIDNVRNYIVGIDEPVTLSDGTSCRS